MQKLHLNTVKSIEAERAARRTSSFDTHSNKKDALIFDNINAEVDPLAYVLLPGGQILHSDREIEGYITKDLYDHAWTKNHPELAKEILKNLLSERWILGFYNTTHVPYRFLPQLIVNTYAKLNISISVKDFERALIPTDRGFLADAKGAPEHNYFFDLVANKIYFFPNFNLQSISTTWDETKKKIWKWNDSANPGKITISEYSLDFLEGGRAFGVISGLNASSTLTEPTDKNAYHPVKLFDGNPRSMWIEKTKGPGIGEGITMQFKGKLTVDEVRIQPGCFWPDYWRQNYRVKALDIVLDGKVYSATFKDEMVDQIIKFDPPVSFSKAVFTIKDVFPTTKWEDTAISEIMVFKDGLQLEIDHSTFDDFLLKQP